MVAGGVSVILDSVFRWPPERWIEAAGGEWPAVAAGGDVARCRAVASPPGRRKPGRGVRAGGRLDRGAPPGPVRRAVAPPGPRGAAQVAVARAVFGVNEGGGALAVSPCG